MLDEIVTSLKPATKSTLQSILKSIDDKELSTIKVFDFRTFDKLLRKRYLNRFNDESDYASWKQYLLECIKNGDCKTIDVILSSGKYQIVDGYARAMAHLVCGIEADIKFV